MFSVDVKHHVYLLTIYPIFPKLSKAVQTVILNIVCIMIKDAKPQVLAYHVQIKSSKELCGTRPNFCTIQTQKRIKGTLSIRTKPNIQILGVVPLNIKPQNNT